MATILMKLSEDRAVSQYDRWISLLTFAQDQVLRAYIIKHLLPQKGKILDVGCGTGKLLIEAGRRGLKGIGVDTNTEMLAIAEKRSKKHNLGKWVEFHHGDATKLEFEDRTFDLVSSTLMISELQSSEIAEFISEASRVSVPNAQVVIGGEGVPKNRLMALFFGLIRRLSFNIVARTSQVKSHPHHDIPRAMKAAGLSPQYRVKFLGGLLELTVAEVK
ncbi:MAG: methyltransferase domain-containing protein [Candidatus Thorarchaeota archaeon]|jgi:ubiquinone/menaquinone biosynthesis C-methylase UbiE